MFGIFKRASMPKVSRSLKKAVPAGVKIAFGPNAGVSKHGRNADEFELISHRGYDPKESRLGA